MQIQNGTRPGVKRNNHFLSQLNDTCKRILLFGGLLYDLNDFINDLHHNINIIVIRVNEGYQLVHRTYRYDRHFNIQNTGYHTSQLV